MSDPRDPVLTLPLTRRTLLEASALGLATLIIPGCGGGPPGGTSGSGTSGGSTNGTSGSTVGSTSAAATGTSSTSAGTTGTAGTSGNGTSSAGTSSTGGTGCVPKACQNDTNTLKVAFADMPELLTVGKAVFTSDPRYNDPVCGRSTLCIVQSAKDVFSAFSSSCTHQCCEPPQLLQTGSLLLCECHGSEFDLTGQVIRGPAGTNLPNLPTCLDGCGNLLIQLA